MGNPTPPHTRPPSALVVVLVVPQVRKPLDYSGELQMIGVSNLITGLLGAGFTGNHTGVQQGSTGSADYKTSSRRQRGLDHAPGMPRP